MDAINDTLIEKHVCGRVRGAKLWRCPRLPARVCVPYLDYHDIGAQETATIHKIVEITSQ